MTSWRGDRRSGGQLRHVKSGAYLTVNRRQSSEADKAAARIDLDETGSESSWFIVTPFYKLQQPGDPMRAGDKVALAVATSTPASYISTSDATGPRATTVYEVNAGAVRTRWTLQLRMRATTRTGATLRDTDIIRL